MGTRNLTCVFLNGEYKVAQYAQWDGYPGGQGVIILDFLSKNMDKEKFLFKLKEARFITDEEITNTWISAGAKKDEEWVSFDVAKKHTNLFPMLSRDTGATVLELIQKSKESPQLKNSIDFAGDSLFCEWAYVIDFDKNTFEVYKGFNKEPLEEGERFKDAPLDENRTTFDDGDGTKKYKYYQVKLAKSFDLDNLPIEREFIDCFKEEDEEA